MSLFDSILASQAHPGVTFRLLAPAPAAALQEFEHSAGIMLPAELRELYQQSNGIAEYLQVRKEEAPILTGCLLMPAEEAAAENRRIRQRPQTPAEASLLVVARAYADGVQFGYRRTDLPAASAAVYAWLPLENELSRVADSLGDFLLGWATGQIVI